MASELWIVTCKCGAKVKLEDTQVGECEGCGEEVTYIAPAPKKAKPKPKRKAASEEQDIEKGVGTFKYTGK